MNKNDRNYADAIDWDANKRADEANTKRFAVQVAWGFGILSTLEAIAIIIALPLKSIEQVIVRVDRLTGQYDVQVGHSQFDASSKENELIVHADLANYVINREGFTKGEAENNYRRVYWNSCGEVRDSWNAFMIPERNKLSPVLTYGLADADRATITNVSFLPSDTKNLRAAQVRYEQVKIRPNVEPIGQKFIATITYRYDQANIPQDATAVQYNPLGFCVTSYRRDADGRPYAVVETPTASSK